MVRLVSGSKYGTIDYSDIQECLESSLLNSNRLDGRRFLDYRKPTITIHEQALASNSTLGYLTSSASIIADSTVLNCRIYAHPSYSPTKSRIVTNVQFNKLDEDEIADINGFNLNYSFWIGGIIDNIAHRLVGNQLDQQLTQSDPLHYCYWILNIILDFEYYDGNGLDWSVFLTNLALKNCKFPSVTLDSKGKFLFSTTIGPEKFFHFAANALCVTFCKIDDYLLLDPSLLEESFGKSFTLIVSPEDTTKYQLVQYTHVEDNEQIDDKLEIAHKVIQLLLETAKIHN